MPAGTNPKNKSDGAEILQEITAGNLQIESVWTITDGSPDNEEIYVYDDINGYVKASSPQSRFSPKCFICGDHKIWKSRTTVLVNTLAELKSASLKGCGPCSALREGIFYYMEMIFPDLLIPHDSLGLGPRRKTCVTPFVDLYEIQFTVSKSFDQRARCESEGRDLRGRVKSGYLGIHGSVLSGSVIQVWAPSFSSPTHCTVRAIHT